MKKITIITGASSGLGAEFARQIFRLLAEKNDNEKREIWLIARNKEKLENVKNEIEGKGLLRCARNDGKIEARNDGENASNDECVAENDNNLEIKTVPMDISGCEGIKRFSDFLESENAKENLEIENLVNNAGFGTYGPVDETPPEREMEMVELNCVSLTGICGKVLPFMEKGSGIINVSSLAAFYPLGNFAVYGATKAYVLNFSIALAAEIKGRGIKVTALCPGSVSTDFANIASNGARKEVLHGKSPVKVVAHCLKKYKKGKLLALWSPKWKLAAFFSRIVNRYHAARFTYLFVKRPH